MNSSGPKFLDIKGICDQFRGGKTWVNTQVRAGLMPQPVVLGPRMVRWPAAEIEAVWRARTAGADELAIKRLVANLQAQRVVASKHSTTA